MIRALLAALVLMALVPLSYGAQQTIAVGAAANDGTGDPGRTAFQKVNSNFTELYTAYPITMPAFTIVCNNTAATASPIQCTGLPAGLVNSLTTSAVPSSLGVWDAIGTAFSGDKSHLGLGLSLQTTGSSTGTTGSPATGYQITPELFNLAAYNYNSSGNNQSTSTNDGRTGGGVIYLKFDQYGQGDTGGIFCNGFINATRASATSFLASPGASCVYGQILSNVNGAYLQGVGDINLKDRGFDDAGIGTVINMVRTNATGAINANWIWLTQQAIGTVPIDAQIRFNGKTRIGLDFTSSTYPDQTLVSVAVTAGGSGYVVGDILSSSDGTCDQTPKVKVLTVAATVITSVGVERGGLCSVAPTLANSMTGGSGTTAVITMQFSSTNAPMMASKADTCWYGNATNDTSVYNTTFPSTTLLGTSWQCYSTSISGWSFVVGNQSILQVTGTNVLVNKLPIKQTGSSSGTVTLKTQAAAGTYEWDWPTTAGTAGQVLTSQAGAGTAQTWTTLAIPIGFGGASVAGGVTTYFAPGVSGATLAPGALSPMAGTLKKLYVRVATAPGGSDTYTYTLYVGTAGAAASTAVTCVISAAATTCNDTTHTAAITAGQQWVLQIVASATAAGTGLQMVGLEFDP